MTDDSTSPGLSSRLACAALFGAGATVGAVGALGRPGADLPLLHVAAVLVLFVCAIRARRYLHVVAFSAGFGCGDGGVALSGSVSWGAAVPVLLSVISAFVHRVPLAVWTRWVATRSERGPRFLATICVATLLAQLGELIGLPSKLAAIVVPVLPELVAGARLVGADLVTGILEASLVEAAIVLARSPRSRLTPISALRATLPGVVSLAVLAALAHLSAPSSTGRVQAGIPQINANSTYYQSRLLAPSAAEQFDRTFEGLLLPLESSDLLVTTEAYDGRFGLMLPQLRDAWSRRSRRLRQAAVVTSYLVDASGGKVNAAGVFGADGRYLGAHEKVHLAPFGEAPLAAGTQGYRTFEVFPGTRLGVAICLESHLRRPGLELVRAGADLIAVTTSDVTFGSGIMVFEHLAMGQLRAIELGRSLIWASNGGPSGVIGRFGSFEGGPFRESAAVRALAATYSGQTPYVRFFELWWSLPWLGLAGALRWLSRAPRSIDSPQEPVGRNWLWVGAGSLAAVPLLLLAGPAAVELRRGVPSRALEAIAELGRPAATLSSPDPFARFRADPKDSATAAVAYFLEYYGFDTAVAPAELPPFATAEDVQASLLGHRIPLREIDLFRTQFRVAALVRLRDGTWGVVDAQEAGVYRLIAPHAGRAGEVRGADLRRLVEPIGLLPGGGQ